MNSSLLLTILWGIVIIGRVAQVYAGESPTWLAVFVPLITLFLINLIDAISYSLGGRK